MADGDVNNPAAAAEIKRLYRLLDEINTYADNVDGVSRQEQPTALINRIDPDSVDLGFGLVPASRGYRILLETYKLTNPELSASDHRKLDRTLEVIENLQSDAEQRRILRQLVKSGARDLEAHIESLVDEKMAKLGLNAPSGTAREIYLNAGHRDHFNAVRIKVNEDGTITHTRYDTGHETNVVGSRVDESGETRFQVNAIEERRFKSSADVREVIRAEIIKSIYAAESQATPASHEYNEAKNRIQDSLEAKPISTDAQNAQRRGNCTTRGLRLVMQDIVDDPKLAEGIYRFITQEHDAERVYREGRSKALGELINSRIQDIRNNPDILNRVELPNSSPLGPSPDAHTPIIHPVDTPPGTAARIGHALGDAVPHIAGGAAVVGVISNAEETVEHVRSGDDVRAAAGAGQAALDLAAVGADAAAISGGGQIAKVATHAAAPLALAAATLNVIANTRAGNREEAAGGIGSVLGGALVGGAAAGTVGAMGGSAVPVFGTVTVGTVATIGGAIVGAVAGEVAAKKYGKEAAGYLLGIDEKVAAMIEQSTKTMREDLGITPTGQITEADIQAVYHYIEEKSGISSLADIDRDKNGLDGYDMLLLMQANKDIEQALGDTNANSLLAAFDGIDGTDKDSNITLRETRMALSTLGIDPQFISKGQDNQLSLHELGQQIQAANEKIASYSQPVTPQEFRAYLALTKGDNSPIVTEEQAKQIMGHVMTGPRANLSNAKVKDTLAKGGITSENIAAVFEGLEAGATGKDFVTSLQKINAPPIAPTVPSKVETTSNAQSIVPITILNAAAKTLPNVGETVTVNGKEQQSVLFVGAQNAQLQGKNGALSAQERKETIIALQTNLSFLDKYKGEIDGQFGSATKEAVIAIQKQAGLTPDGIVGKDTAAAIKTMQQEKIQEVGEKFKDHLSGIARMLSLAGVTENSNPQSMATLANAASKAPTGLVH